MKSKASKIAVGIIALLLVIAIVVPVISFNSSAAFDKSQYAVTSEITDYDAMNIGDILALNDKSLTWVFAGDSITHNASWSQGMNGYAEWFEQYLYDIGRNNDSVINTAWGGADTSNFQTTENGGADEDPGMGLENFITKYNPDVVFISIGMNDRGRTTEAFRENYVNMLQSLYDISYNTYKKIPKVVVLSPTPVSSENVYDDEGNPVQDTGSSKASDENFDSTLRIRNALEGIVKECNEGEYKALFSDMRSAFLQEAVAVGADYHYLFYTSSSDGNLHPNAAGQYLMFKTLMETFEIDNEELYSEEMPIFQITYDDIIYSALYDAEVIADTVTATGTYNWSSAFAENSVWIVAGGKQMSGYEGPVVNRSILRLFDNAMRKSSTRRDIRIVSAAAQNNTPVYLSADENYTDIIGKHVSTDENDNTVFMLLPEVPEVYENGYEHETQLAAYETAVRSLLAKTEASGVDVTILWTPLASNVGTINTYLEDYAEVIRNIAAEDSSILLFDAYAVMNNLMTADTDGSLVRNWFDNSGYISPLGAVDVTYAFTKEMNVSGVDASELTDHNLRESSDNRIIKGNYVRDYYETVAEVVGTTVTLDVSAIIDAYQLSEDALELKLLPGAGAGNYHEDILDLKEVAKNIAYDSTNKTYTFTAPCADLNIAICATIDGKEYRFKDVALTVDTDAVIEEVTPNPTSAELKSLEVVGAPAFELADTQDVTLYQYQKYVQVRATAEAGLKIAVTYTGKDDSVVNEVISSGKYSGLIPADKNAEVKVTVSGTVGGSDAEKTYTLNLTRPEYPDIIITEVMTDGYPHYDVSGTENYTLVEIYNASGRKLNLLDYSIGYKNDYPTDLITETKGEWPYYFTGNNQAFNSNNVDGGKNATYTGINQITKYSAYWNDGSVTTPKSVDFPADSTMVIWIKEDASADLTYETLIKALEENAYVKNQTTLSIDVNGTETAVVPTVEQLVVAETSERLKLTDRNSETADNAVKNFYLDNIGSPVQSKTDRAWLFILGSDAQQAKNGAITEAGNDIVSASKYVRIATSSKEPDRLSSVFSYDTQRGMSLVKDEAKWDDRYNEGHTSEEQGYSNLTSFGAIEYWQKPVDLDDEKAPEIKSQGAIYDVDANSAAVKLLVSDDKDIRYIELNVKDASGNVTTVKKDLVLEKGVTSGGLSTDIATYEYTYAVADVDENAKITFWGYVEDGNGNTTEFGDEEAEVSVCEKQFVPYTAEAVTKHLNDGTYPTLGGCLFAGWYTTKAIPENVEDALAVVVQDSVPEGVEEVYALFVPEHVLSVKAQLSAELIDTDTTNDGTGAMRLVTTVDSLLYRQAGFEVSYVNSKGEQKNVKLESKEVHDILYAVDYEGTVNTTITYEPQKEFCASSNYFRACTVINIPVANYGREYTVTPYWITLDGSKVRGVTAVKSVEQGLPKDTVYVSATGSKDAAGYGTYAYPYETLDYALRRVKSGGTIYIKGDYAVSANFVWNAHNKAVTIKGDAGVDGKETLDFSVLSALRLNDAVTFEDIILNLPSDVYAEGYKLKIADSVSFANEANTVQVYGGSKQHEVVETNLELYAGTYKAIYGGGYKTNVMGDTNVTIAGTVNEGVDFRNHDLNYPVYGGSYNGTVYGDTFVIIGTEDTTDVDEAIAGVVHGGGSGEESIVEGTTHVNLINGSLMGIYGGSRKGTNADTQVVMTGGVVEQIFGGSNGASMTGNTDVRVLGGEVERRIYGGCYTEAPTSYSVLSGVSISWPSEMYSVEGYTSVTIGRHANCSLEFKDADYNMALDNSIYAISRGNDTFEGETGVFIFNQDSYANGEYGKYEDKIGYSDYGSYPINLKDSFSNQTHNYIVKANEGGMVYSEGEYLRIEPGDGMAAIVTVDSVDGEEIFYAEGNSKCALPELNADTNTREIYVKFTSDEKADKTDYKARIGKGYYKTVEDALNVVNTTDATTIELIAATVEVESTLSIQNSKNITIKNAEGVNATMNRADALVDSNLFNVASGSTLTLEGITLDGRTSTQIGAGTTALDSLGSAVSLVNVSGEANLNGVTVQYAVNSAENGNGGAIYNNGATVTATNCTFNSNKATNYGGAIFVSNSGALYLEVDQAYESTAALFTANGAKQGGAVYVGSGSLTAEGYAFTSNTSIQDGAAIRNSTANMRVIDCSFTENIATRNAGAILNSGADMQITGSTFTGNQGVLGGAIKNAGAGMQIKNSTFSSNIATGDTGAGGAIYNGGANMSIVGDAEAATFDSNTATTNGGAIYLEKGSLTAGGYTLTGNGAKNGAGVYVKAGTFTMNSGTTIASNAATANTNKTAGGGGGVYVDANGTLTMTGGTIKENTTGRYGAGVSVNDGTFNMNGGTISYHGDETTGGAIEGAGVCVFGAGSVNMTAGDIEYNYASGSGAGVSVYSGRFTMKGGTIQHNTAGGSGGAFIIRVANGLEMTGGHILNNVAQVSESNGGGAIFQAANSSITINGGEISGNESEAASGGAIYMANNTTLTIINADISDNTAKCGGAIYNANTNNGYTLSVQDTKFEGNEATTTQGGAIYLAGPTSLSLTETDTEGVTEAIFKDNTAATGGGAIYKGDSGTGALEVVGYEFDGNTTTDGDGGAVSHYAGSNSVTTKFTNTTFINNEAESGHGGAIRNRYTSLALQDCIVGEEGTGNIASDNGGAIYSTNSATVTLTGTGSEGTSARFAANSATNGGAIFISAGTLNVNGYTFDGNEATNGGAIKTNNGQNIPITVTGSTFINNIATASGGAIYVDKDKGGTTISTIENTSFTGNSATENGGAICLAGILNGTGCTFTSNTAANGGAIAVGVGVKDTTAGTITYTNGTLTTTTCDFTSNTATNGAGVYVLAGTFTMNSGNIASNTATSTTAGGGGVYIDANGTFTMENGAISNNKARSGGAIYHCGKVADGVTIGNGTISGNHATTSVGGAIYMDEGTDITIVNGKITGNKCDKIQNAAAIYALADNRIYLTGEGEISGNTTTGTVEGILLNGCGTTSRVELNTTFAMGNEIRFNTLATREMLEDSPVLIISGESLDYTLNLGFHPAKSTGSRTVYIKCDTPEIATAMIENKWINYQYETSWRTFEQVEGTEYIRVSNE